MKTKITFDGKTYTEVDNTHPVMTTVSCDCGNKLHIPLGAWVLGVVDSCSHCGKSYPQDTHCSAVTQSWIGLLEDEELVDL